MIAIIPKAQNLNILSGEILFSTPITLSGGDGTQPIRDHFASSDSNIFKIIPAESDGHIWMARM